MSGSLEETVTSQGKKRRSSHQFSKVEEYWKVVVNVYNFLKELKNELVSYRMLAPLSRFFEGLNIKKKTALLCNVGPTTVVKVVKQNKENLDQPVVKKSKIRKPIYKCDEFNVSMIRRVTQQFYSQNTYPTAQKILSKCQENPEFPPIRITLFKKWLKEKCKFKYRRINKKPVYLERNSIVLQRETYLRSIKLFRESGYKIFYSDETWASPDQARNRCWQFLLTNEEHRAMEDIFSGQVLRDMDGYTGNISIL